MSSPSSTLVGESPLLSPEECWLPHSANEAGPSKHRSPKPLPLIIVPSSTDGTESHLRDIDYHRSSPPGHRRKPSKQKTWPFPTPPLATQKDSVLPSAPFPTPPRRPCRSLPFMPMHNSSEKLASVKSARTKKLSICTSPCLLQSPATRVLSTIMQNTACSTPEPPSPITVKQKQRDKLARHFGESVPYELIFKDEYGVVDLTGMIALIVRDGLATQQPVKSEKLEQDENIGCFESVTSTGRSEGLRKDENLGCFDSVMSASRSAVHKFNKQWVRERAGRRWAMNDYSSIVQALREL